MRDISSLKRLSCSLLLAASPLAVVSASAQDSGGTWLDAINVTGTRTEKTVKDSPRSVTVLDKTELEKKAPESIAEMLRDVPGVELVDASVAGMKRVRIRGESSRRVTILVDGQEITDHSTYGTPILVDPNTVERIDVIRGPASVLYGAKAIGGVINVITKKGGDKPIGLDLSGTYYSATNGWQGSASVHGTVGSFDYRLSGGLVEHGDREVPKGQYTTTGKLENSSFSNDNLSVHLGYKFGATDNHYISLKADQHRLDSDAWNEPGTVSFPLTKFELDLPQRDRKKIGLYYDGKDLGPVLKKVHLDAYYQTVDRLFTQELGMVVPPTFSSHMSLKNESDDLILNYGGTAQADFEFHPDHYTIAGVQYLSDNLDTTKTTTTTITPIPGFPMTSINTDEAYINTISLFAQDEWSLGQDWKLTAGLRYYHVEAELSDSSHITGAEKATDDKLLKSAGLTYSGIRDTTLRALYSEGYIYPTLLQLYVPTAFGGGGTTYANSDLTAETSSNYEAGFRYDSGGLLIDGSAYYTTAKDYIDRGPCSAGACPGGYSRSDGVWVNINEATTYGVELLAEYAIPDTAFTPYVNATWTRRKFQYETFSTYNTNVPSWSGRLGIKADWHLAGINGWGDLYSRLSNGVKSTDSDGDTDEMPGWATLNLALGANFGEDDKFQLVVNLNNLTDKEYRTTFGEMPGAGRSIEVTARMKF